MIAVASGSLCSLLGGFSHYEFHAFDLPEPPAEDALIEMYVAAQGYRPTGGDPLLPRLPLARVYVDSHDDCYLYAEAREQPFLTAILKRMLHLYFATLVSEVHGSLMDRGIADLPDALIERIWRPGSALTILRDHSHLYPDRMRVGFSDKQYHFTKDQPYNVVGHVEYSITDEQWSLS